MKFKNVFFALLPSVLASSSFAMPKDLLQLKSLWQSKEALLTPYVQVNEIAEDQSLSNLLMHRLNELMEGKIAFKMEHTHDSVRAKAIKSIFEGENSPAFCSQIKAKPVVAKEGWTQDKTEDAQKRADLAQCKRTVESVLDGIFHARPQVYMIEEMRGDRKELHLYIESLTEKQKFLEYSFQK